MSSVSAAVAALLGTISGFLTTVSSIISWVSSATGCGSAVSAGTGTVGDVICNVILASNDLPGFNFRFGVSYGDGYGGFSFGQVEDHVENPDQTPISALLLNFVGWWCSVYVAYGDWCETLISGGVTVASADHGCSGSAAASYGLMR